MPNVKEKLLELSRQLRYCAVDDDCLNCERWEFDCGSRKCLDDLLLKAAELLESVANGVTVQQWISVKDRLPDEDERVIVWLGNNRYNDVRKDTDRVHNGRWVRWGGWVTHWSPWNMPQPPEGE